MRFQLNLIQTLKSIGLGCYCSDLGRISGVDFEPSTGNGDYWYDGLPNNDKRKVRTTKHITKKIRIFLIEHSIFILYILLKIFLLYLRKNLELFLRLGVISPLFLSSNALN